MPRIPYPPDPLYPPGAYEGSLVASPSPLGLPPGVGLPPGFLDSLDSPDAPSDAPAGVVDAGMMQAIMEARRREEALSQAAAEQVRRDRQMAQVPAFVQPGDVPRGFPSQDPGDQMARYNQMLETMAPLQDYPVQAQPQAVDPLQDAVDRSILQRRLDALGR